MLKHVTFSRISVQGRCVTYRAKTKGTNDEKRELLEWFIAPPSSFFCEAECCPHHFVSPPRLFFVACCLRPATSSNELFPLRTLKKKISRTYEWVSQIIYFFYFEQLSFPNVISLSRVGFFRFKRENGCLQFQPWLENRGTAWGSKYLFTGIGLCGTKEIHFSRSALKILLSFMLKKQNWRFLTF